MGEIIKIKNPTICVKCKNFISEGRLLWDKLCKASERKKELNPVTGIMEYSGVNDLGGKYYTEKKYEYCHKVNTNAKCKHYEAKR